MFGLEKCRVSPDWIGVIRHAVGSIPSGDRRPTENSTSPRPFRRHFGRVAVFIRLTIASLTCVRLPFPHSSFATVPDPGRVEVGVLPSAERKNPVSSAWRIRRMELRLEPTAPQIELKSMKIKVVCRWLISCYLCFYRLLL